MEQVKALRQLDDPRSSLPFIHEILSTLREEVAGQSTLFGFIGTPWTLAAYAMEGHANKNCLVTKVSPDPVPNSSRSLLWSHRY